MPFTETLNHPVFPISACIHASMRRGVTDLDGRGDAVGGIVVMRSGENAKEVIDRVKEKLEILKKGLPNGVTVTTAYDRNDLTSMDRPSRAESKAAMLTAMESTPAE